MPGIVTDDIEIKVPTPSGGRGGSSSDGSDGSGGRGGDGSGSGGSGSVPQRTYITGMTVGLGGILMFFMALVSAYIVRKDIPNSGWHPLAVPRILWLNTAVLIASSFTLSHARKLFKSNDQQGFRHWWSVTTILGRVLSRGTNHRLAAAQSRGLVSRHECEQQLFLRLYRCARLAPAGRCAGADVDSVSSHAPPDARHSNRSGSDVLAFHGWFVGVSVSTFPSGTVNRE